MKLSRQIKLMLSSAERERTIRSALNDYLACARDSPLAEQISAVKPLSMFTEESLHLLALFAEISEGAILEVGSYIGGSTICLALGKGRRKLPLLTVEVGGTQESHPTLPSSNIVADLYSNLEKFNVREKVEVIVGHAHSLDVKYKVSRRLRGEKVGLFVVDADNYLLRTLENFIFALRSDCVLVFDDYVSSGASEKSEATKCIIDTLWRDAFVREFGVFREGTWIGQLNGLSALERLGPVLRFKAERGYCFTVEVRLPTRPDSTDAKTASQLVLLENEKRLPLAHSLHDDIRNLGRGRYAHWSSTGKSDANGFWDSTIYFSSSDNTSPAANGMRYSITYPGGAKNLDLANGWF